MYRKAFKQLLDWKNSRSRKPLVLLGARQVGKTWLMREFGKREYENVVYVNCDAEPLTKDLFQKDYDIRRLLLSLQAISGESIKPSGTLIILDEIQEAPRGMHSLKYFCENAPEYHIMAAGSLLGVTLEHKESFPVGKVDMLRIYPLDFEEFLLACDQKPLCELLYSRDQALVSPFSSKLQELLFQYYFVGGMPEVVKSFIEHNNLEEVRKIQETIIDAYRRDISKHTSKIESIRIGQVLASLPSQLAKEKRRFIYGVAKPGGRAADFELAIQWLIDAGLAYKANRVSKIAMPLKIYQDLNAFKLFFLDTGLLCCMADVPSRLILAWNNELTEYKGMLTEEYVAQQLASSGFNLFYWSNDHTPAEIDFVIQYKDEAIPIEVKASTNVRGKSIAEYVKKNPGLRGFRFSLKDYDDQGWLLNIPLYEIPFRL